MTPFVLALGNHLEARRARPREDAERHFNVGRRNGCRGDDDDASRRRRDGHVHAVLDRRGRRVAPLVRVVARQLCLNLALGHKRHARLELGADKVAEAAAVLSLHRVLLALREDELGLLRVGVVAQSLAAEHKRRLGQYGAGARVELYAVNVRVLKDRVEVVRVGVAAGGHVAVNVGRTVDVGVDAPLVELAAEPKRAVALAAAGQQLKPAGGRLPLRVLSTDAAEEVVGVDDFARRLAF